MALTLQEYDKVYNGRCALCGFHLSTNVFYIDGQRVCGPCHRTRGTGVLRRDGVNSDWRDEEAYEVDQQSTDFDRAWRAGYAAGVEAAAREPERIVTRDERCDCEVYEVCRVCDPVRHAQILRGGGRGGMG